MEKPRRRSDDDEEHIHRRTEKRRRWRRRGSLHILANDCTEGFSVYKLDVDDFDSEDLMDSTPRRLSRHRHLVVRLDGRWSQTFVSVGAKIFSLHRSSPDDMLGVVYDAGARSVSTAPAFLARKNRAAFWAAGGAIYALDCCCGGGGSEPYCFERLAAAPPGGHGEWRWERLPRPLFEPGNVVSHAVHPDGSTAFLSVYNAGTFSFDGEGMAWARHGDWLLPFDGEAFYVRELRAWVGIFLEHRGRVAACRVVDTRGGAAPEPACRFATEDLLRRTDGERHGKANLTYMGDGEFCIQQTFTREVDDGHDRGSVVVGPMLLRIITFRVAWSGQGELCAVSRRARIYKLSQHSSER